MVNIFPFFNSFCVFITKVHVKKNSFKDNSFSKIKTKKHKPTTILLEFSFFFFFVCLFLFPPPFYGNDYNTTNMTITNCQLIKRAPQQQQRKKQQKFYVDMSQLKKIITKIGIQPMTFENIKNHNKKKLMSCN